MSSAQRAVAEVTPEGAPAERTGIDALRAILGLEVEMPARGTTHLLARLREPQRRVDAVYERLAAAPRDVVEGSRAGEWLLDNHYIIRRAFRGLKSGMPAGFERRLPRLKSGAMKGLPRVYALAVEIVRSEQSHIDLATVATLLRELQTLKPLSIAETWALPALLRLAVLERLAAILESVAGTRAVPDLDDTTAALVCGECVRSLRTLETADWNRFVEDVSAIEAVLRRDPAGVYAQMDFQTRDRYRKAVEELAKGSGRAESEVAEAALRRAAIGTGRAAHVGHALIDDGRPALEAELGYRAPLLLGARAFVTQRATPVYLGSIAVLATLQLALLAVLLSDRGASFAAIAAAMVLAWAPAGAVAVALVNALVTRFLPPCVLPKLDFDEGIPPDCRTLVAVPCLVTSPREILSLVRELEIRFLANQDPQIDFALLTDLRDAPTESADGDDALVDELAEKIRELNTRHGSEARQPFHLLHRPRRWCASENCWMGWERKRGKLAALNNLLLGDEAGEFSLHVGDDAALRQRRFVICLDADTELPRGAAAEMVATLAHPLNAAQLDAESGAVLAGYTVLQPRVEMSPQSARSWFSRLFAAGDGLDPYTHATSDAYQDLFREGIFAGKGIYEVASFHRSTEDRIPDSSLLSHDLFEGIHGRAGLLTDVVFVEDYPDHYLAFTRRMHRWARGDWQLLPWLATQVPLASGERGANRLHVLSRWKIFDNLRRTLVAPMLLAFLVVAWLWFPGSPLLWTALALLVPATPGIVDAFFQIPTWIRPAADIETSLRNLRTSAAVAALEIVFLPHQAAVMVDAMVRTLWRVYVSRQRLLEWTAAAHTARGLARAHSRNLLWGEMAAAPAIAAATTLLLIFVRPEALLAAAPVLALWMLSPEIAERISRPLPREREELSDEQTMALRLLARRTWSFFETFVGPEDQWLPPDHFQEDPRGAVARRTSPTNIGLLQLSTLSAYDFGYRGMLWVVLRMKNVFDTLDRMERYRGHFLNWYSTSNLEPLLPRYVSTVDSGNLVACFVAVKESCEELEQQPIPSPKAWDGWVDTVGVLAEVLEETARRPNAPEVADLRRHFERARRQVDQVRHDPTKWPAALASLSGDWCAELDRLLLSVAEHPGAALSAARFSEIRRWAAQVREHLERTQREITLFAPWLELLRDVPPLLGASADPAIAAAWKDLTASLSPAPTVRQLPALCDAAAAHLTALEALIAKSGKSVGEVARARGWMAALGQGLLRARQTGDYAADRLREVAERAERYLRETDFTLLYDKRRRLFHIGYDVAAARLDDNHYDLMASEARLASFIAIAKGDVPEEHWLYLGRPIGKVQGERALLSWSGTMFEYLMPPLLLREEGQTLIGLTCDAAVKEQIAYAQKRGIPWGISESGYARVDAQLNYQYRAFGVPTLGFRRDQREELVVTPYASLLALAFQPRAVSANLEELRKLEMRGPYGFYEAIDFTWSRLQPGKRYSVVRSYMAHHQGMIFASLNNFLNGEPLLRRFHHAAMARTAELLLFERPARSAPIEQAQPPSAGARPAARRRVAMNPWPARRDAGRAQAHVLSNGRYSVLLTDAGGGYAKWGDLALTRWTPDPTLDESGFRIHVRERFAGDRAPASPREVLFHPHQVEMHQRLGDVSVRENVAVIADVDVEIRLVTLSNEGTTDRRMLVCGYGEVVLNDAAADRRHPAFSKMFVESEYVAELNALLFRRRPREVGQPQPYLLHMLVLPDKGARRLGHETSRERFLGRGGVVAAPAALARETPLLTGATGTTLDPIFALAAEVEVSSGRRRQFAYVTLVAETREEALTLAARHRSLAGLEWAIDLAKHRCEDELERLGLDGPSLATAEALLSSLLYPNRDQRAPADVLERNTSGRSGLWRFAVSGDLPILLVRLQAPENAVFLRDVLRAQSFWRGRGVAVDVVVLNERASTYSAELTDRVGRAVATAGAEGWFQRPGGVFLVHADQITDAERTLLYTAARVSLDAGGPPLSDQVRWSPAPAELPPLVTTSTINRAGGDLEASGDLAFANGLGGFSEDGSEYVIRLEPGQWTPAPWVNVIANARLGCVVSESGGGYTWGENSGENRLTPWSNDPVSDTPGEALYLRDEETGAVWSPTPLPARSGATYEIRHAAGSTTFRHRCYELLQELRVFVAAEEPVKILRLELTNESDRPRRVTATQYVEWVLASARDGSECFILPSYDTDNETLLARNPWNEEFGERFAFLAASQKPHGFTADRTEMLGRRGARAHPEALDRVGLGNNVRPAVDPCAAIQLHLDLAPGETKVAHFLLGQGKDREEAIRLVQKYRPAEAIESEWAAVQRHWDRILGAAQVRTPDPAFDVMLNRWLLYQTLSSRIWGRTGFYQSSGAFGFRDQLQDVAALLTADASLCRNHLVEAARHQFEKGDVLHWWHPPGGAGIRSRCSDDLLWLPFIAAHYVAATGDDAVLDEEIGFLRGEPLPPHEAERYGRFGPADRGASLYEHCLRSFAGGPGNGAHGLPLFGSGDWNDGMNRVGIEGRGESVWLGWFRYATLMQFAPLCERRGDANRAGQMRREADTLRSALETHAWDGDWYRRGYYDDGSPLGSADNDECRIDSVAQSWAVLSGAAQPERARRAMESALANLVRPGIVLLFTPAFDQSEQDPGYVRAYPPGVRENGGQYTHAAIWLLWALLEVGEVERAVKSFGEILPTAHTRSPDEVNRYRVEPYVLAADVYGVVPLAGRGGWTWYTGSAGWAHRFGWEAVIGLRLENGAWRFDPCVPHDWPSFDVTLRLSETTVYEIHVDNSAGVHRGVVAVRLDGRSLEQALIPRVDDGRSHKVEITLGVIAAARSAGA